MGEVRKGLMIQGKNETTTHNKKQRTSKITYFSTTESSPHQFTVEGIYGVSNMTLNLWFFD